MDKSIDSDYHENMKKIFIALVTIVTLAACSQPINVLTVDVPATPTDVWYAFSGQQVNDNLVVNGDFEQGNTGFTTQYTYGYPVADNLLADVKDSQVLSLIYNYNILFQIL